MLTPSASEMAVMAITGNAIRASLHFIIADALGLGWFVAAANGRLLREGSAADADDREGAVAV